MPTASAASKESGFDSEGDPGYSFSGGEDDPEVESKPARRRGVAAAAMAARSSGSESDDTCAAASTVSSALGTEVAVGEIAAVVRELHEMRGATPPPASGRAAAGGSSSRHAQPERSAALAGRHAKLPALLGEEGGGSQGGPAGTGSVEQQKTKRGELCAKLADAPTASQVPAQGRQGDGKAAAKGRKAGSRARDLQLAASRAAGKLEGETAARAEAQHEAAAQVDALLSEAGRRAARERVAMLVAMRVACRESWEKG
jgi:hypothetical protein